MGEKMAYQNQSPQITAINHQNKASNNPKTSSSSNNRQP